MDFRKADVSAGVTPDSVARHVHRILDIEAIRQPAAMYPFLVDSHELETLVEAFTEDGRLSRAGAVHSGRAELRSFLRAIADGYDVLVHTAQQVIDIDAGAKSRPACRPATAKWACPPVAERSLPSGTTTSTTVTFVI